MEISANKNYRETSKAERRIASIKYLVYYALRWEMRTNTRYIIIHKSYFQGTAPQPI